MTDDKDKQKQEEPELPSDIPSQDLNSTVISITDKRERIIKISKEKLLQGKTLEIYWYILSNNSAGVREIQKSLNISSPGTVSYQIKKLVDAGIVTKNRDDGKYYATEDVKKGLRRFYVRIGYIMIPRFSLYIAINILGFVGYLVFAGIYGDQFITNPGVVFLLLFMIFSTTVFIVESIKIWRTSPSSHRLLHTNPPTTPISLPWSHPLYWITPLFYTTLMYAKWVAKEYAPWLYMLSPSFHYLLIVSVPTAGVFLVVCILTAVFMYTTTNAIQSGQIPWILRLVFGKTGYHNVVDKLQGIFLALLLIEGIWFVWLVDSMF